MDIYHSMEGYIRVKLTSADLNCAIQGINRNGIVIHDLKIIGDLTACFTVSRRDYEFIKATSQKKGDSVESVSRIGIFWRLWGLRRRPLIIFGLMLLLFLTFFIPSRIFFLEVEGNKRIPDKLIEETAQYAGIGFGSRRREIRSEKIKNTLLDLLPELQWAGVNTYGCRAVISVRERSLDEQKNNNNPKTRIVAGCDGVITGCTVTEGTGLCSIGQAVVKGQLLISGYTDCGGVSIIGRAEGEVFALTRHEVCGIMPLQQLIRSDSGKTETKYSLCIGKKRINLYKGSGISDGTCVKMVARYKLAMFGGYTLPIVLIKERITPCVTKTGLLDPAESVQMLARTVQGYLQEDGIARTIVDVQQTLRTENDHVRLDGVYSCIEMIGREQAQEIGDIHGKTD